MPLSRDELCLLWPTLDRCLALLEQWDCPQGIIFESNAASCFEAVTSVAAVLGGHVEKFERHPVLKDDWDERAGRYLDGRVSPNALFEPKRDRIVVIVLDLDRQPEWLQIKLKTPMDTRNPPRKAVCLLATADDAKEIPDYVRSHFHVVRKTG